MHEKKLNDDSPIIISYLYTYTKTKVQVDGKFAKYITDTCHRLEDLLDHNVLALLWTK